MPASLEAIGQTLARLDRALAGFFHAALGQRIVWDVREAPALLKYVDYLDSSTSRRLVRLALNGLTAQLRAVRATARASHPWGLPSAQPAVECGRATAWAFSISAT